MRKGTTPTFLFTMPFNAAEVKNARVVFGYGHDVRLKKEGDECEISDNEVKVKLSQTFFDSITDTPLDGGNL